MTVACNSGLCSISYNGLSIDSADNVLPENFFVSNFNDVLKMCDGSELIEQKHSLYVNGKLNGKEFKLTASPTGLPILLTIPDLCMRIDFNNVKVKNK